MELQKEDSKIMIAFLMVVSYIRTNLTKKNLQGI